MRTTISEAHIENVKLSAKESGSGTDTGATLHLKAPFTGGWPADLQLKLSNDPEDTPVTPDGFILPALGKDHPVSITFYAMDLQTGQPTKGARLFRIESALARAASIKRAGGVPYFSGVYYLRNQVQILSEWFTSNPSYTGFVVIESLGKELFDEEEEDTL